MTADKYAERMLRLNPGLSRKDSDGHIKLYKEGRLIGILPRRWRTEGPAANSKSQFRRAGLRLP